MRGAPEDAGSLHTVASYLRLLDDAGLLAALQKHAGDAARRRASVPKLQVRNNALISATAGRSSASALQDPGYRGRLVESSLGAYLAERALQTRSRLEYWRNGTDEVDFVYTKGDTVLAIEVKSAEATRPIRGLVAFKENFGGAAETLLVGEGGTSVAEFLGGRRGGVATVPLVKQRSTVKRWVGALPSRLR